MLANSSSWSCTLPKLQVSAVPTLAGKNMDEQLLLVAWGQKIVVGLVPRSSKMMAADVVNQSNGIDSKI